MVIAQNIINKMMIARRMGTFTGAVSRSLVKGKTVVVEEDKKRDESTKGGVNEWMMTTNLKLSRLGI